MNHNRRPAGFWKIFGAASLSSIIVSVMILGLLFTSIRLFMQSIDDRIDGLIGEETSYDLQSKSLLTIDLGRDYSERSHTTFDKFNLGLDKSYGLHDLIKNIHEASMDQKIEGIYLKVDGNALGLASSRELRNALIEFKESGKWIVAYGDSYTQKAYYVASVADDIYMYPTGILEFKGLSSTITFFKGFLDKYDLEVQAIRGTNNQYKSFVEPFLSSEISEANRKQTQRFLDQLWNVMLDDISESRGINTEDLQIIADSLQIRNGKTAVKHRLLDGLKYPDEIELYIREQLEIDDDKKITFVSPVKYAKREGKKFEDKMRKLYHNVAVIYANGSIHGGKSGYDDIGDETLVKAINQANDNPMIKAIVLRVNSPGGDALASDLIWDALNKVKSEKPVVVSMGNTAASGGYYISCMADKIFAEKTSITGSIGVFLLVPHTGNFFKNNLGLSYSRVKSAEHADMSILEMSLSSFNRKLTDEEKKILQQGVDETYLDFLTRVTEGRHTFDETAEVDSIGQGRVWAGTDALRIGLVDTLGGLHDAINYAGKLANLDKVVVGEYPKFKQNGLSKILEMMGSETAEIPQMQASRPIPEAIQIEIDKLKELTEIGRMQARLMWNYTIE